MKHFSKMLGPVAVAMASLWATHASAANFGTVFASVGGSNTYAGTFNPALDDRITFSQDGPLSGAFIDYWAFDLSPAGNVEINATFNPSAQIPGGLTVTLFSMGTANISGCATANNTTALIGGGTCTTFSNIAGLSQIALVNNGANNPNLTTGPTFLSSGKYVFRISGNSTSPRGFYSGLLSTNVIPEPGSLALAGLALLGAAVTLRKRKTA